MVEHRPIDRTQHAIGYVGWAGNLQKMASGRASWRLLHKRVSPWSRLLATWEGKAKGAMRCRVEKRSAFRGIVGGMRCAFLPAPRRRIALQAGANIPISQALPAR
jgi:hypothetical protein